MPLQKCASTKNCVQINERIEKTHQTLSINNQLLFKTEVPVQLQLVCLFNAQYLSSIILLERFA